MKRTISCRELCNYTARFCEWNVHLWLVSTRRKRRELHIRLWYGTRSKRKQEMSMEKKKKRKKKKKTKGKWKREARQREALGKLSFESGPGIVAPCGGSRGTDYFRVKTNLARRSERGSRVEKLS